MDTYTHRITLQGPTGTRTLDLSIGSLTIGRQVGCDVVLEDTLISRRHARLDCSALDCTITDLNSSNGTRVGSERLVPDLPHLLAPGEIIQIGSFSLTYQRTLIEQPAETPPTPTKTAPEKPRGGEPQDQKAPVKVRKSTPAQETPPVVPPADSPPPPKPSPQPTTASDSPVPIGLDIRSRRLIQYLPDIYHTDFMERFLGIFEATLIPIEWTIDNFDLFLSPDSTPEGFLPWLANWFNLPLDGTWSVEKRRLFVREAHAIYSRLGTRWALSRILEIYTGVIPDIDDTSKELEPHCFRVRLPLKAAQVNQPMIEQLINNHKPAYTTYTLEFLTN